MSTTMQITPEMEREAGAAMGLLALAKTQNEISKNQDALTDALNLMNAQTLKNAFLGAYSIMSGAAARASGDVVQGGSNAALAGIGISKAKKLGALEANYGKDVAPINTRLTTVNNEIAGKTTELNGQNVMGGPGRTAPVTTPKAQLEQEKSDLVKEREHLTAQKKEKLDVRTFNDTSIRENLEIRSNIATALRGGAQGASTFSASGSDGMKAKADAAQNISSNATGIITKTIQGGFSVDDTLTQAMGHFLDSAVAASTPVRG